MITIKKHDPLFNEFYWLTGISKQSVFIEQERAYTLNSVAGGVIRLYGADIPTGGYNVGKRNASEIVLSPCEAGGYFDLDAVLYPPMPGSVEIFDKLKGVNYAYALITRALPADKYLSLYWWRKLTQAATGLRKAIIFKNTVVAEVGSRAIILRADPT